MGAGVQHLQGQQRKRINVGLFRCAWQSSTSIVPADDKEELRCHVRHCSDAQGCIPSAVKYLGDTEITNARNASFVDEHVLLREPMLEETKT